MKRKATTLIVCFFAVATAFAQNKEALAKSDSLFASGVDLYQSEQYAEAIPLFIESDKIDKAELDASSNRRDYSAMWLASCYYKVGNDKEAEKCCKYYKLQPIDRRYTVSSDSLFVVGTEYYSNENYDNALICFLQSRIIERGILGEDSYYSRSLEKTADCYSALGYYAEAILTCKEALNIRQTTLGKKNAECAALLNKIALYNSYLGNYPEALRIGKKALDLYEEIYGKGSAECADALNNMVDYNSSVGNYGDAINYGTELLAIQEKTKGKESYEYVTLLSKLAECNSSVCSYDNAIALETEALNIRENMYGKVSGAYISSLIDLANYNAKNDNYDEAISLQQEASKLHKKGSQQNLWP